MQLHNPWYIRSLLLHLIIHPGEVKTYIKKPFHPQTHPDFTKCINTIFGLITIVDGNKTMTWHKETLLTQAKYHLYDVWLTTVGDNLAWMIMVAEHHNCQVVSRNVNALTSTIIFLGLEGSTDLNLEFRHWFVVGW